MATKKAKKPSVGDIVDDALRRRQKALKARIAALKQMPPPVISEAIEAIPKPTPHMALAMAAEAATKGWLVAEGDSWFDYPGSDILNFLKQFGYNVESVARAGDRVEMMAFGRGQLDKFIAAVEKVIGAGQTPKAILLSGGGNDIAGSEFGFLINHAGSPKQGFNKSIVTGVIDERIRDAYESIIRKVTDVCQKMLNKKIRILMHGYGFPIPNGKGFLGGWGPLPGPWLRPGFIEKGFDNLNDNTKMMAVLMKRFNAMLDTLQQQFSHVRYVNLLPLLPASNALWENELHLREPAFKTVAQEFQKTIEAP